jgi:type I restriction enzyme S subunit
MKQGLLHDLLTRGIDENGELRDPERHPERFKDSPLGRIPTEWEVVLGERLFSLHSGTAPAELREDGGGAALYLKVDDFNHPANQYGLNVAELTFGPRPGGSGVFSPGAIVFPKRGAAIFQNRVQILLRPVTVDPNLMVLHPLNVDAQFLQNYLIHFNLSNICDNSGLPQINNKHIYPLLFAVPDISEQRRVIASLDSLAARLRQEKVESMKLRTLKHGLMDDLLTGRVRVPIPEEATA